jgi:phosphoribosylglycinamide formyltransferase-1
MRTDAGPKVLEYNCRFGDPETQVILPLLADDLLPWLEAVAMGAGGTPSGYPGPPLRGPVPVFDRSAVGVVLAAPGYPERPQAGAEIKGLEDVEENVLVFHASTEQNAHGHVVTAGGRVLTVVGTGTSIEEAARRAYAAPVWFEGMQRRRDIAWQGIPHPPTPSPSRGEGESIAGDESGNGADPQFLSPRSSCRPVPPWPASEVRGEGARIAVLASGDGSNLQALLDACRRGDVDAEIAVVVSNRAEARALERARRAGVPAIALPLRDRESDPHEGGDPDPHEGGKPDPHERGKPHTRRLYEERLLEVLRPFELDLIVLAGWMLILSAHFLDQCPCPLINVHPALLEPETGWPEPGTPPKAWVTLGAPHPAGTRPAWVTPLPVLRGAHAVRDALALGLPYTGVSIHYVTPEVDAGPVILSETVPIEPGDDEDSLYRRIKAVEHRLLPRAVQSVLREGRQSMLLAKSPHPPTPSPILREGEKQCRHTSKSLLSQGGREAGSEGISAARMIRRGYPQSKPRP